MIDAKIRVSTGAASANDEPSHIHIPRPSRVLRLHDNDAGARRDVLYFAAHGDDCDAAPSFAFNELEPVGA
jgi:hypothetical protein